MNASRALAAEQAIALTAGVARDLIAQGPTKGLPRPRFLMAVFAFYAILGLVAAFGRTPARVAVAFGGVAALTTVVVGPGGAAILGLFQRLSGLTTAGTGALPNTEGNAGSPATGPASSPYVVPGSGNSRGQFAPTSPNAGTVDKNGNPVDPFTGRPGKLT